MAFLRGVVVVLIPPEPGIEGFVYAVKGDLQKLTSRLVSAGILAAIVLECEEDDGIVSASLQSHIFVHVHCAKSGEGPGLVLQLHRSWGLSAAETLVVMVGPRVVPESWKRGHGDVCPIMWRVGQPVAQDGPHLQSLPQVLPLLVQYNCEQVQPHPLVIGVVMKGSRYSDLARRGAFPVLPTEGACFFPLAMDMPFDRQGPLDALVQRLTDCLLPVVGEHGEMLAALSKEALRLQAYLEDNPDICVVDPLEDWAVVLDRIKLNTVLQRLPSWKQDHLPLCRPPRCITVDDFGDVEELFRELSGAGIVFPLIVKPSTACGIPGSHRHAVVFSVVGLRGLEVGRPACIQEYVNHGGMQHKVYVMGNKLFVQSKESTPDYTASTGGDYGVLYFDTLKSLHLLGPFERDLPFEQRDLSLHPPSEGGDPIKRQESSSTTSGAPQWGDGADDLLLSPRLLSPRFPNSLNWEAANLIALFLIRELNLHLFGFDVVVDVKTGDHVVVDVNYLPTCAGVEGLPEAMRAVVKTLVLAHKQRGA